MLLHKKAVLPHLSLWPTRQGRIDRDIITHHALAVSTMFVRAITATEPLLLRWRLYERFSAMQAHHGGKQSCPGCSLTATCRAIDALLWRILVDRASALMACSGTDTILLHRSQLLRCTALFAVQPAGGHFDSVPQVYQRRGFTARGSAKRGFLHLHKHGRLPTLVKRDPPA